MSLRRKGGGRKGGDVVARWSALEKPRCSACCGERLSRGLAFLAEPGWGKRGVAAAGRSGRKGSLSRMQVRSKKSPRIMPLIIRRRRKKYAEERRKKKAPSSRNREIGALRRELLKKARRRGFRKASTHTEKKPLICSGKKTRTYSAPASATTIASGRNASRGRAGKGGENASDPLKRTERLRQGVGMSVEMSAAQRRRRLCVIDRRKKKSAASRLQRRGR